MTFEVFLNETPQKYKSVIKKISFLIKTSSNLNFSNKILSIDKLKCKAGVRSVYHARGHLLANILEVLKPLAVKSGKVAPAFGQPGGGVQYLTSDSVRQLIKDGYLKEENL